MKWMKQLLLTAACMTAVCLPAAPMAETLSSPMLTVQAEEETPTEYPTSGNCGENAGWTIDEEGTLTMSMTTTPSTPRMPHRF